MNAQVDRTRTGIRYPVLQTGKLPYRLGNHPTFIISTIDRNGGDVKCGF